MMKRKIAKLVSPKKFEIFEEPLGTLKDDEILLKIISCGLCHSDVPVYLGEQQLAGQVKKGGTAFKVVTEIDFPVLLGHEPVGVIEDVGKEVKDFKVGDFVSGWKRQCFADYLITDTTKLVKINSNTKEKKKCLIEPLACIVNIERAANPLFGDSVVVIGCGFMGLLALTGLNKSGAFKKIAIDLVDSRLDLAKKFGATHTLNAKKENVVDTIQDITEGKGADIVIEITGRMAGFDMATQIVKSRGKILIPSLYAKPEVMKSGFYLMLKAPTIISAHPFYSDDYDRDMILAAHSFEKGILPVNKLITHEFSLDNINEGFEVLTSGNPNYIKGIIVP